MPLLETKGAGSAQGFGLSLGGEEAGYIEDVFSTWLIKPATVNTAYTITNGIDVSGEGGMVWMKSRDAAGNNLLYDTARGASAGANNALISNSSAAQQTANFDYITGLSNGFTVNFASGGGQLTNEGINYASWTFRKQPKFFDIVTYTGDGGFKYVNHNLGSVPGCIIVKRTDSTGNWAVYHRSLGAGNTLYLNTTGASAGENDFQSVSSTQFAVYDDAGSWTNKSGGTYVAYLFAHDAGGFGESGLDNVISCGSYTGNGSATGPVVTLGYEPQWVMIKRAVGGTGNWVMLDSMRGFTVNTVTGDKILFANTSAAEDDGNLAYPTATGFGIESSNFDVNVDGDTYIYIAIRRGPMKVPTSGTSVFSPVARTGTGTNPTVVTTNTNPDLLMSFPRTASPAGYGMLFWDKLRGVTQMLTSSSTAAETATSSLYTLQGWQNTGYQAGADFIDGYLNYSGSTYVNYLITRAPGFFDEVCYTGNGVSGRTLVHNLAAVPQIVIVKARSTTGDWRVNLYNTLGSTTGALLQSANAAFSDTTAWFSYYPTASDFKVGSIQDVNGSGNTYVAYLFATVAGVSKVGSYTGTGTTQVINCGFTAGSRFVMIKRTDSTGDWYVWDSARGIVAGNDPYLLLNSTAAEVTNTDYVDTAATGFEISSTAPAAINANGGTFIFLAIA